jgi:hypothetical protein
LSEVGDGRLGDDILHAERFMMDRLACCWINRMAPGILPVVTSFRKNSPSFAILSGLKWAPAGISKGPPASTDGITKPVSSRRSYTRIVLLLIISAKCQDYEQSDYVAAAYHWGFKWEEYFRHGLVISGSDNSPSKKADPGRMRGVQ